MTMDEEIKQFEKQQKGILSQMFDWFHGIGPKEPETYTPEEAFRAQLRDQQRTLEEQLQFAKRVIQDGRQARTFLDDPFVKTLHEALKIQVRERADQTISTAKSMEDVSYARGWKDGVSEYFTKLETLVKLGRGAEETLVSLTKRQPGG